MAIETSTLGPVSSRLDDIISEEERASSTASPPRGTSGSAPSASWPAA